MKKLLLLCISIVLFAEEPSAFNAGNIDSPNPYGLTQSEKKLVEQNKNIQSISRNLFDANQTQTELRNELDGIKSLIGNIGERQQQFSDKLNGDSNGSLKDINNQVDILTKKIDDNFKLQNENYDKIMLFLGDMARMIDDISQNYVSKDQLKLNLGKNYKEFKNKELNSTVPAKSAAETNTSNVANNTVATETNASAVTEKPKEQQKILSTDEAFKLAEKHYKANQYVEAKALLQSIIDKNFSKKATSQFYLGEIEYKNNEFKNALGYYQDSINTDDKSSFIPLMLFHSAICLEKLNKKGDAKKVLDTLIKTYPDNYIVKSAKKKRSEL